MVLVDVEVPALDEVFDFELDDEMQVNELLNRIITLISGVQGIGRKEWEDLYLYHFRQERILNPQMTLKRQEVRCGDRLILL